MADTRTTHLNLIKQDANYMPDYAKDHTNLDKLDTEIFARGKKFNGEPVGDDGEFHINRIPYADNLETTFSQKSNESFVIRTTGGEASIEDGNAWLMLIKGTRVHTGYSPYVLNMVPTWETRPEGESNPTASIDDDTFIAYVATSGTTVLTYSSTGWSADPEDYGITITGTPIQGDYITITYTKEEPGTITQSTPAVFTSTGWNLYDHTNTYAILIKYSDSQGFKISGTYDSLSFSKTLSGNLTPVTPVSGGFNPFSTSDPIGTIGYLFVEGGNTTNTAIWMTREDWTSAYDGSFQAHTTSTVDISSFMTTNFPYGLLQVGTVQDEINFNIGIATSRVQRLSKNSTNMNTAKNSGRQYEYDENYIYLEREVPVTTAITVDGGYVASDHGIEFWTGTNQAVYAETVYGANLKNKLERDTLTISQQTLTTAQQGQVRTNIGAVGSSDLSLKSWTPKLYDMDTYKRDMPSSYYWKIGSLYIMTVSATNFDFSGVSTMIQIRNMPCTYCIGGTVFLQGLTSTAKSALKGIWIQGTQTNSKGAAYVRENVISSDFSNASTGSQAAEFVFFGI